MDITLKNKDTLNITLSNGNKVEIETHNEISNIEIRNIDTYEGSIELVKITNYGQFNSVMNWFKGGIEKVSKTSKKNWFKIGEEITLFKN